MERDRGARRKRKEPSYFPGTRSELGTAKTSPVLTLPCVAADQAEASRGGNPIRRKPKPPQEEGQAYGASP